MLTPQETRRLFEILENLRKDGKSIVFISHKLNEVMEISDRITAVSYTHLREATSGLNQLGVNHIEFIPFYPGAEPVEGIGLAVTPVSYTHLDVYKRQPLWSGKGHCGAPDWGEETCYLPSSGHAGAVYQSPACLSRTGNDRRAG